MVILKTFTGNVKDPQVAALLLNLWANMLLWELNIDCTDMIWSNRSEKGEWSFIKMLLVLLPCCTVHQKNKNKTGAAIESWISLPLDDWCNTARDKQLYRHWAGHQIKGSVWIPLLSQGCYQYSQHKPCQLPYNPVPYMHLQYCQRRWNAPAARGSYTLWLKQTSRITTTTI